MSSRSQPIAIRESAPATKKDCHGGCNAQLASTAQPEEEKEDVEAEDKSPLDDYSRLLCDDSDPSGRHRRD